MFETLICFETFLICVQGKFISVREWLMGQLERPGYGMGAGQYYGGGYADPMLVRSDSARQLLLTCCDLLPQEEEEEEEEPALVLVVSLWPGTQHVDFFSIKFHHFEEFFFSSIPSGQVYGFQILNFIFHFSK